MKIGEYRTNGKQVAYRRDANSLMLWPDAESMSTTRPCTDSNAEILTHGWRTMLPGEVALWCAGPGIEPVITVGDWIGMYNIAAKRADAAEAELAQWRARQGMIALYRKGFERISAAQAAVADILPPVHTSDCPALRGYGCECGAGVAAKRLAHARKILSVGNGRPMWRDAGTDQPDNDRDVLAHNGEHYKVANCHNLDGERCWRAGDWPFDAVKWCELPEVLP